MSLDMTSFDAALNVLYDETRVENMVYEDRPLLALLPKKTDFFGKKEELRIYYGTSQGRSRSFSRAQTRGAATSAKVESFELVRKKDYGIAYIDNETLEATANQKGAAMKATEAEIDGVIQNMSNNAATALYREGYGVRASIGSVSSATITLADVRDVVHFEVGMELGVAAAATSGAARAYGSSTNGLIITGVNRGTGVLTFGYNVTDATNGIPSTGAGDWLFVRGDRDEGSSPAADVLMGLAGWIPDSDPTSTSFFGVDRSVDVTRLGGLRKGVLNYPIEEALIDGAALVHREGKKITHYFMNPERFADLTKALGAKVQYVDVMANADVGFRGVKIIGPSGDITVVSDPFCPFQRTYGLNIQMWVLWSLGQFIRPLLKNGATNYKYIDQYNADGVECRFGYYSQTGCRAPGSNIVLKHDA